MKTLVKLVMLLAVLAICMPAQGEILIYSKLYRCWEAWEVFDDGVDWEIDEWVQKGFLVLWVEYDENDEIDEILGSYQIEYEREGRDKWYWHYGEDYIVERVDVGDEVIWVLEEIYGDELEVEILMVRGKPRDINVGLGRDEKREVARALKGNIMYLYLGEGVEKAMCTLSLRLHNKFTKLANDPEEGDQDFEYAVFNVVIAWLEDRGYQED
jgi:hypothetical protein